MTEIVLASNNKKKIAELRGILSASGLDVKVLSLSDIGFTEDIEEFGSTFEVNSLIKASVPAAMGYIGIADDSGLCVDALNGEPGIYSARYSRCETGDIDEANRQKLLRNLAEVPDDARDGGFVCTASLVLPEGSHYVIPEEYRAAPAFASEAKVTTPCAVIRGECRGEILHSYRGEGGFGYDCLFYSPELGKSFAEATQAEKDAVSHRGRAMEGLCKLLSVLCDKS